MVARLRMLACLMVLGALTTHFLCQIATAEEPQPTPPAEQPAADQKPNQQAEVDDRGSVEQVYSRARPSLAVVTCVGRDGKRRGMGTGFVVSADGLIATNLHVMVRGGRFRCKWPTANITT